MKTAEEPAITCVTHAKEFSEKSLNPATEGKQLQWVPQI